MHDIRMGDAFDKANGRSMGGSIAIAARFNDDEAICIDGWKNFVPRMVMNQTTLSGDDSMVEDDLRTLTGRLQNLPDAWAPHARTDTDDLPDAPERETLRSRIAYHIRRAPTPHVAAMEASDASG